MSRDSAVSISPLEEALYGVDARARDEGRAYLISRGSAREVEALVEVLDAPLSTTRRRAVRLLSDLQPHRALPPLRAWVNQLAANRWERAEVKPTALREALVNAARLLNQLTARGDREVALLTLWSAPMLKVKRATLCPAAPDELLSKALLTSKEPKLIELASAEALRRLQRLDPAFASAHVTLTNLLRGSLVAQDQVSSHEPSDSLAEVLIKSLSDLSSAEPPYESQELSSYHQLIAFLYPDSGYWSSLALKLIPLGLRTCRERPVIIEALELATQSLSMHSSDQSHEQVSAQVIEALTALERVSLLNKIDSAQPLEDSGAVEEISTSEEDSSYTPLSTVSDQVIDRLIQAPQPEIRSLTARLLPAHHPGLALLSKDSSPEVVWRARVAQQDRWGLTRLSSRLGSHERLALPSAQPPYGLRSFDTIPTVSRVRGALALCQARFDVNLGVAMRSAEAAGLSEIFVVGTRSGSLTSARGAEHALPITWLTDPDELILEARRRGYQLVAVQQTPDSEPYHRASYPPQPLFILGSEDAGLPDSLRLTADLVVEIPLYGAIDSLNVATAATCVMMHWRAHLE